MQLSEQDEKELQRLADEIDDVAQKLRAFWEKHHSYYHLEMTKEYVLLQKRLEDLKKAFDEIPRTRKN
jgi:hypothetical protein